MPSLRSFIALETSVATQLGRKWKSTVEPILELIDRALVNKQWDEAFRLVNSLSFDSICAETNGQLEMLGLQSLMLGASQVRNINQTSLVRGTRDIPEHLFLATKSLTTSLCMHAMERVRRDAMMIIEEAIETEKELADRIADNTFEVKKAADKLLAQRLNAAVLGNGKALVDIGANLTTSRLVSYGFLSEAHVLQISTYQVTEILDDRTCPVCQRMHGKTFEVEKALTHLDTILRVQDPQELKSLSPWPKQTKQALYDLDKLSNEELQGKGWDTPPYHPLCRGTLVLVGTVTEVVSIPPVILPPSPVMPAIEPPVPVVASVPAPITTQIDIRTLTTDFDASKFPARDREYYGNELNDAMRIPIDDDVREAISHYQGPGYANINKYLRGSYAPSVEDTKYYDRIVAAIDRGMVAEIPENLTVYRGVANYRTAFGVDKLEDLLGAEVSDPAFMSTSIRQRTAENFADSIKIPNSDAYEKTILTIRMREGSTAMHVEALTGSLLDEAELLLPKGSRFRVIEVRPNSWERTIGPTHRSGTTETVKVNEIVLELLETLGEVGP